mmetsp:Transcript_91209/g.282119  ORF Transcript_91209/g.282119 Transcript_91209/m.282119 type:complete len:243 (-) Transcript_91209:24-752(-)
MECLLVVTLLRFQPKRRSFTRALTHVRGSTSPVRGGATPASTNSPTELPTHFCGYGTSSHARTNEVSSCTTVSSASSAYSAGPRNLAAKASAALVPPLSPGQLLPSAGQRRSSLIASRRSTKADKASPRRSLCSGSRFARRCWHSPQAQPRASMDDGSSDASDWGGARNPSMRMPSCLANITVSTSLPRRYCKADDLGPTSMFKSLGLARPSSGLRNTSRSTTRSRVTLALGIPQSMERITP